MFLAAGLALPSWALGVTSPLRDVACALIKSAIGKRMSQRHVFHVPSLNVEPCVFSILKKVQIALYLTSLLSFKEEMKVKELNQNELKG